MKHACPYPECPGELSADGVCQTCGRRSRQCRDCGGYSRAFASYCRHCGAPLPPQASDWPTVKGPLAGNARTLFASGRRLVDLDCANPLETTGSMQLGKPCQSLLHYAGVLFAFWSTGGQSGFVLAGRRPGRFKQLQACALDGPINADPLVHAGSLYVAAGKTLYAYSLDLLTRGKNAPRWRIDFEGMPISSLAAVGESLYLSLAYDRTAGDWLRLDSISETRVPQPVRLGVSGMSVPTGSVALPDPDGGIAVCVMANVAGEASLGTTRQDGGQHKQVWQPVRGARSEVAPCYPLASENGKLFAIFNSGTSLCRVDIAQRQFEECIVADTKGFALAGTGQPFVTTLRGVGLPQQGKKVILGAEETIESQPLVLGSVAAAVGLSEGRVRTYDLQDLGRSRDWNVGSCMARIKALAPLRDGLAVGDSEGGIWFGKYHFADARVDPLGGEAL